jgi:hypothetical protein
LTRVLASSDVALRAGNGGHTAVGTTFMTGPKRAGRAPSHLRMFLEILSKLSDAVLSREPSSPCSQPALQYVAEAASGRYAHDRCDCRREPAR